MDEARLIAHVLGEVGQKGDDVMAGLPLDLVNAFDLEGATLPDCLGGRFRDHSQRGLGVTGLGLDLEPNAEAVFMLPNLGHLRTAVAGDHAGIFLRGTGGLGRSQKQTELGRLVNIVSEGDAAEAVDRRS